MKWKDSGEMDDQADKNKEEYFDEEQYSPWSKHSEPTKLGRLKEKPGVLILLCLAIIVIAVALFILLTESKGNTVSREQLAMLEDRVRLLEERLDKFEAIDEKVTRIWEQAKSFEKFKDRFDRGEASMSLRMDHLTLSLETLQKQLNTTADKNLPEAAAGDTEPAEAPSQLPATGNMKYHTVVKGDTSYSISKRYNIDVETLLRMNRMEKGAILHVGQKLIVQDGR
ncbi:MAG: LysM peptidoglycan-binding domain-containing protein [Desulfatitalea sp.]|nr:LysM peptidoglycan-binding domain-containing protein [Desulfatitalea sp.]NNK00759.1 LysM peptidoglycan-binding domain-containing protein [Desulfatitalea sp.]